MTDKTEVKQDRRYTRDHEWALAEGERQLVGVTAFAVDQLGDITLVSLDIKVGDRVEAGKVFGTIESVKTLSDLYAPLTGQVLAVNGELDAHPELINEDCWGKGWMIALQPEGSEELLTPAAYAELIAEH